MAILTADYSSLDYDAMAAAIGLKAKHMPMLIGSFLEESGPIIEAIEAAIGSNDFEELKLRAHSIKGSAGNLKFTEIYEMAKEMELSAAESDASFDYSGHLAAIKDLVATIPS